MMKETLQDTVLKFSHVPCTCYVNNTEFHAPTFLDVRFCFTN
jgi:hypothetical protein